MSRSAPTADELGTEALRRVGYDSTQIDAALLTRVSDHWIPQVLSDIAEHGRRTKVTRFRSLQNSATIVTTVGQRRYDWPEDYQDVSSLTLLQGAITGTLTADTSAEGTSLVTATTSSTGLTGKAVAGYWLVVTSGEAVGVMREVTAIVEASPVITLTIDAGWDVSAYPVSGDTFLLIDQAGLEVKQVRQVAVDQSFSVRGVGTPSCFAAHDQTLELEVAPDATMALVLRYYSSPSKISADSPMMSRILTLWRSTIMKGLLKIGAEDVDDPRYARFLAEYESSVSDLVLSEADDLDFEGFVS